MAVDQINVPLSSEALVCTLHGEALRLMAATAQRHFQGVAQAARSLPLSGRMRKKLLRLDAAFAVLRHISQPYVDTLMKDLAAELADASATSTMCASSVSLAAELDLVQPSSPCSTSTSAGRPILHYLDDSEALAEELEDSLAWRGA